MTEHYFSEAPAGDYRPREIEAVLGGSPHAVLTAGGVFSPDRLDRGTEVLLRTVPGLEEAPEGAVLDIGCGWGPIALDAAIEAPGREVWAVDVNARSRELTRENAARLGLGNVRVAAPDEVPSGLGFAEIRSNPPIRVGKEVLHGILAAWLPRLLPGGAAYLVVAKHLGADSLQRWIAAEFAGLEVSRAGRDKGFHVIEARARA